MNKVCPFCHKNMAKIEHHNPELFDVFLCENCLFPDYMTRYRQVYYANEQELLATTIRIDEYYVVCNYAFNFSSKRTNFTTIFKNVIGALTNSLDLEPLTWDSDEPVCDLDLVINLPFHDPALLKSKLRLYTLLS